MDLQHDRWYNRKADILAQLTPEEIKILNANSSEIWKTRGEMVYLDESDEGGEPKVYIVDQGYIRICRLSDEGKRLVVALLGPGDFLGAISPDLTTFDPEEYLEVVRKARLIAINARTYHQVIQNHPDMILVMVRIIENRKRSLERRLSSILFKDVCARTAEILLEIHQKYAEACPMADGNYRDITLTHQEIADIVGAARPVVSGIISDMMKAGILHKHDRTICFQDMDGLRLLAEHGVKALSRS